MVHSVYMQGYKQSCRCRLFIPLHVNKLYDTCTYNRLPEDEPSSSKHVEDIVKFKIPGADKSLARPGRKEARKHVRGARDFNNIKTQAVI